MDSLRGFATLSSLGLCLATACSDDGAMGRDGASSEATSAESTGASTGGPDATGVDASTGGSGSGDSGTSSEVGTQTQPTDTGVDSSSGDDSTGGAGVCEAPPACDAPPPPPGPLLDWNHTESIFVTNAGGPNHRGRDMFYLPDDEHWVLAKFAYAVNDWDLSGEQIDLYLLRGCEGEWEALGSAITTFDDEHAEIEGVADSGGWVYFLLPEQLELGRHRIWAVVRGDGTSADVYIDVVEPNTPFFLTDVDGTLTTSETEEFAALLGGTLPMVNASAPEAMWALVDKGYHAFYLTARPEWLGARTREFIEARGLPPGLYHTTLSFTGATGSSAVDYKSNELDMLAARQLVPSWTFGNTSSDGDAYEHANVQPLTQRIFYQFDDVHGGRRIDDYADLVPELEALDTVCD